MSIALHHSRKIHVRDNIDDASYSPSGHQLATAYANYTIVVIWDTATWQVVHKFRLNNTLRQLRRVIWHPTEPRLTVLAHNGVYHYNTATGNLIHAYNNYTVASMAWFPSGRLYVTGDYNRHVTVHMKHGRYYGQYQLKQDYRYVVGVCAVDDQHFVVVGLDPIASKYCLQYLTMDHYNCFTVLWQLDGSGFIQKVSPLVDHRWLTLATRSELVVVDIRDKLVVERYRNKRGNMVANTLLGWNHEFIAHGNLDDKLLIVSRATKKPELTLEGDFLDALGMALHPHNPMEFVAFGSDAYFTVCLFAYNVEE
jgi:hypothetical protein